MGGLAKNALSPNGVGYCRWFHQHHLGASPSPPVPRASTHPSARCLQPISARRQTKAASSPPHSDPLRHTLATQALAEIICTASPPPARARPPSPPRDTPVDLSALSIRVASIVLYAWAAPSHCRSGARSNGFSAYTTKWRRTAFEAP